MVFYSICVCFSFILWSMIVYLLMHLIPEFQARLSPTCSSIPWLVLPLLPQLLQMAMSASSTSSSPGEPHGLRIALATRRFVCGYLRDWQSTRWHPLAATHPMLAPHRRITTDWSVLNGHTEVTRVLLDKFEGVDVLAENEFGISPVFEADRKGDEKALELLLVHPSAAALEDTNVVDGDADGAELDSEAAVASSPGSGSAGAATAVAAAAEAEPAGTEDDATADVGTAFSDQVEF